jgi:hypothetical protein
VAQYPGILVDVTNRRLAAVAVAPINFNLMVSADCEPTSALCTSAINRHVDRMFEGVSRMKNLSVLCVALCISLSATAAFARGGGGMGSSHMSVTGGAFGTSAVAPGTNSLGTALSSSGIGRGPIKGPLLGTSPAIDREEAKVDKMMGSICRGC